jgi:hypothetical protein
MLINRRAYAHSPIVSKGSAHPAELLQTYQPCSTCGWVCLVPCVVEGSASLWAAVSACMLCGGQSHMFLVRHDECWVHVSMVGGLLWVWEPQVTMLGCGALPALLSRAFCEWPHSAVKVTRVVRVRFVCTARHAACTVLEALHMLVLAVVPPGVGTCGVGCDSMWLRWYIVGKSGLVSV